LYGYELPVTNVSKPNKQKNVWLQYEAQNGDAHLLAAASDGRKGENVRFGNHLTSRCL